MTACAKTPRCTVIAGDRIQLPTPNAQRPTLNRPASLASTWKTDYSISACGLSGWLYALPNTRAANHVAGQLLRCGTSSYGNHGEVEAAESRKDFVHKLKVCLKELKETRRWLRLLAKSFVLPETKMTAILNETEELIRIFFSSIRTAERNAK
jgi:four helix bundle protein